MISNINTLLFPNPSHPTNKDLESQIDRLNLALSQAMQEIELNPGSSRVSSQVSFFPFETDNRPESPSFRSEDLQLPLEFEQKIEELLLSVDRSHMIIEDLLSEQFRNQSSKPNNTTCTHDLFQIRYELELALKKEKNQRVEEERKEFEKRLETLDKLNEMYLSKKVEVQELFEKLVEKERVINEEEKELRASRMAFDRRKMIWEQEHGVSEQVDDDMPNIKPSTKFSNYNNPLRSSLPTTWNSKVSLRLADSSTSEVVKSNGAPNCQASIETRQSELNQKVEELEKAKKEGKNSEISKLEVQIDSIKNKIATMRGEQVMMMSNQSSRLLNNIVQTMQKQNIREEIAHNRKEIIEKINFNLKSETREVFRIKNLNANMPDKTETKKRFLFSDAPTPKNVMTPRTCEKENPYKVYFDNKKRLIQEKENELVMKEKLLKDVFREIVVKYPEAKEIVDNLKRRNRN